MQILSAEEMRAWDQFTIRHEPISSLDLMERAAGKCADWILLKPWRNRTFKIFCGKGNNGGDGLVIARRLAVSGYTIHVFMLHDDKPGIPDFEVNLERLISEKVVTITSLTAAADLPVLTNDDVLVDALFGTGLNRPLEGFAAEVVRYINQCEAVTVSVDLPSGLLLEHSSLQQPVVEADFTLTFQTPKKALLLQENAAYTGEVKVLDIGLDPAFLKTISSKNSYLQRGNIEALFKPRKRFSHKGTFGHAALIAGGWGKIGAAVLAAHACLRMGAGLTTAVIPKCGYPILQTVLPEVMVLADEVERELTTLPDSIEKFTAVGIGPGIGSSAVTIQYLTDVLHRYRQPMVIDADGLNCLAKAPHLLQHLPPYSILTPHPKEFERLFGEHANDFERVTTAQKKSTDLNAILILKGHHTLIALPDGSSFYNSTGNAGMAKGGSGDVLTGILTSLLAQGYNPKEAARLGVYIHGWAGDVAAKKFSKEAMTPGDLIGCLSDVFLQLEGPQVQ